MPTYVTRIVVTQTDGPLPPDNYAILPGLTRWDMQWTKVDDRGKETHYDYPQPSIAAARRMTMNLLQMRPPDKSVEDVLTLIGFDEG